MVKPNQKLLQGLDFYQNSDYSKVKNKKGHVCSICNNNGVVYAENGTTFCPRKQSINFYNSSLIPARYSKCRDTRFDNGQWKLRKGSIQEALNYSIQYVDNFPDIPPPFFLGSPGLGKTHLSVCIISELIFSKRKKCIFKQFRDLLSDIKDIYVKNQSEKDFVETLCHYDVLVIDDLGATRMSEWETSVLDTLIAKRYNSDKHTIFNSNLALINGTKYKVTDPSMVLDTKIGDRNISRIFEMCNILELTGEDFRKKDFSKK